MYHGQSRRTWIAIALLVGASIFVAGSLLLRHRHSAELIHGYSLPFQSVAVWLPTADTAYPSVASLSEDGTPLLSWRVRYQRENMSAPLADLPPLDRPWDSKDTRKYELSGYPIVCSDRTSMAASMLAVSGRDTAWSNQNIPRTLSHNLIVVVENTSPDCHWMRPCELDVEHLESDPSWPLRGRLKAGFFVVFADREVWFLDNRVPPTYLKVFLQQSSAKTNSRDELLGKYVIRRFRQSGRN